MLNLGNFNKRPGRKNVCGGKIHVKHVFKNYLMRESMFATFARINSLFSVLLFRVEYL